MNPEYRAKRIHPQSQETRQKISEKRVVLWQDVKFVRKMANSFQRKPTKPEQRLIAIFAHYLPEFKYNGDFSLGVTLGGLIPDFINTNGKKEVIELFGDYWHSPEVIGNDWHRSELGRVMIYNSLGYSCLVIWEHELRQLAKESRSKYAHATHP